MRSNSKEFKELTKLLYLSYYACCKLDSYVKQNIIDESTFLAAYGFLKEKKIEESLGVFLDYLEILYKQVTENDLLLNTCAWIIAVLKRTIHKYEEQAPLSECLNHVITLTNEYSSVFDNKFEELTSIQL